MLTAHCVMRLCTHIWCSSKQKVPLHWNNRWLPAVPTQQAGIHLKHKLFCRQTHLGTLYMDSEWKYIYIANLCYTWFVRVLFLINEELIGMYAAADRCMGLGNHAV